MVGELQTDSKLQTDRELQTDGGRQTNGKGYSGLLGGTEMLWNHFTEITLFRKLNKFRLFRVNEVVIWLRIV